MSLIKNASHSASKVDIEESKVMPFTSTQLKELKEVFDSFDLDGSGCVSKTELSNCIAKLGNLMTEEDVSAVIEAADQNGDGNMDFEEFVGMVEAGVEEAGSTDDSIAREFSMFDMNGDGAIDKRELRDVLKALGQSPSKEELDEMFKEADIDGDGQITLEEFKAVMCLD